MIGVIADDITGATDVALAFRRTGLRTLIYFGTPQPGDTVPAADTIVVALKTRTAPVDEAVATSVEAARWLRRNGAGQLFFKYCSTFDSTPAGNIGPVADALAALVDSRVTVVVPSSPDHHRTQYMGQLFVARQPLAESSMRHHPLTPMTDSSVPRLLRPQTPNPVELIDLHDVRRGVPHLRARLDAIPGPHSYAVLDAIDNADLLAIAHACLDQPLVTGAAGLAAGIGAATRELDPTATREPDPVADGAAGPAVALAGSCSARTLDQIAEMRRDHPAFQVRADAADRPAELATAALRWYDELGSAAPAPLIYSSLPPEELQRVQASLGTATASQLLETAMGLIAVGLRERGVRRIVVAGGETSGAVVAALGLHASAIGEEMAPGVPWLHPVGADPSVSLLLKSGNFGGVSLLRDAVAEYRPAMTA